MWGIVKLFRRGLSKSGLKTNHLGGFGKIGWTRRGLGKHKKRRSNCLPPRTRSSARVSPKRSGEAWTVPRRRRASLARKASLKILPFSFNLESITKFLAMQSPENDHAGYCTEFYMSGEQLLRLTFKAGESLFTADEEHLQRMDTNDKFHRWWLLVIGSDTNYSV